MKKTKALNQDEKETTKNSLKINEKQKMNPAGLCIAEKMLLKKLFSLR